MYVRRELLHSYLLCWAKSFCRRSSASRLLSSKCLFQPSVCSRYCLFICSMSPRIWSLDGGGGKSPMAKALPDCPWSRSSSAPSSVGFLTSSLILLASLYGKICFKRTKWLAKEQVHKTLFGVDLSQPEKKNRLILTLKLQVLKRYLTKPLFLHVIYI